MSVKLNYDRLRIDKALLNFWKSDNNNKNNNNNNNNNFRRPSAWGRGPYPGPTPKNSYLCY